MTRVSLKTSRSPRLQPVAEPRHGRSRAWRRGLGHQQARGRARPRRAQRDQLLGQVVVELVEAHASPRRRRYRRRRRPPQPAPLRPGRGMVSVGRRLHHAPEQRHARRSKPASPSRTSPCRATAAAMLGPDDFAGRKLVLYFYPKDDTSGCTLEAIGFTAKPGGVRGGGHRRHRHPALLRLRGTPGHDAQDPDRVLLRTLRHALHVRIRRARESQAGHWSLQDHGEGSEELRHERRDVARRGDGRRPERRRARAHRPPARRLPRDVQLLHDVPPVHVRQLLERRRGPLPDVRAAPRPRDHARALPRPARSPPRAPIAIEAWPVGRPRCADEDQVAAAGAVAARRDRSRPTGSTGCRRPADDVVPTWLAAAEADALAAAEAQAIVEAVDEPEMAVLADETFEPTAAVPVPEPVASRARDRRSPPSRKDLRPRRRTRRAVEVAPRGRGAADRRDRRGRGRRRHRRRRCERTGRRAGAARRAAGQGR